MKKKLRLTIRMRTVLEAYSFLSLWLIGFAMFMAIPLGRSFYYAFNKMNVTKEGLTPEWTGTLNFRRAFSTDVNFLPLLQNSFLELLIQVPLILIFAMFAALLLNRPLVGRTFFRGVFFLPVIIASGAVLAEILEQGAERMPLFTSTGLFMTLSNVIPPNILEPLLNLADQLTLVMWNSGVQILIFLAGLQTISSSLYEAADIDGATKWESFWKITFPMIAPMILVNTLFTIVNSFTAANNQMMAYIRTVVFNQNDYGYGAAIGWIYFLMIFLIIAFVFWLFRKNLSNTEGRR
ncbi:carbohydrate ABC transporter permease [Paenibacillus sp. GCM10012307]|uniref:Sugar ABC transporter permease n=1 Tax=Paenibacillus roseus TaxID=2798579 RepID=A0A934JB66_9BACL|nr:sugar ABC transporter permease [Paenibacillus roseus]MBJ6363951.1 sugar ABC transporter permease [Paenibacillus roseus]